MSAGIAAVVFLAAFGAAPKDFIVEAKYEGGATPAVLVSFSPSSRDVHVNENPAPRLSLDSAQAVLEYKAPAAPRPVPIDPATAKPLDLSKPVRFPVSVAKGAARGAQSVKGTVTYFYCSDRERWCKRGTADVDIPVIVP